MYSPLPPFLIINQSYIHGNGLFSTTVIFPSVDLGITHIHNKQFTDEWIRTPLGGFYNHSETPNCCLIDDTLEDSTPIKRLVTLQHISPNEELTCTYSLYDQNF
ncbi:MAG: hypothetical protein COB65_06300 [Thalassobium sp.]|nr:MAG: hypothetical protein COB65_06300 [Thalassobium sp.]